jgi:hypothetical protein
VVACGAGVLHEPCDGCGLLPPPGPLAVPSSSSLLPFGRVGGVRAVRVGMLPAPWGSLRAGDASSSINVSWQEMGLAPSPHVHLVRGGVFDSLVPLRITPRLFLFPGMCMCSCGCIGTKVAASRPKLFGVGASAGPFPLPPIDFGKGLLSPRCSPSIGCPEVPPCRPTPLTIRQIIVAYIALRPPR